VTAAELAAERAAIAECMAIMRQRWDSHAPLELPSVSQAEVDEAERRANGGTTFSRFTDWGEEELYRQDLEDRFA
jgi:hypothetical protein